MASVNKKIVLIRPSNSYSYNFYPSLANISLGSALKKHGYDVELINCAFEKKYLETIARKAKDALFVGVTMLTSEVPDAYRIMKFVKERLDIPIVVGGTHCTLHPEQMAQSELVDFVVVGEGEEHIIDISKRIESGEFGGDKIYGKKILKMENLTPLDYHLDPDHEIFFTGIMTDKIYEHPRVEIPMRWIPYETSRGCPSECTFCIDIIAGDQTYRKKSAEKVLDEIEELIKKHRITHVKFIDDNFCVDTKRVIAIAQGILDRALHITWDAECRADYFKSGMMDNNTLSLAKESGLVELTLGIESGSPRILELMKKRVTPEQAEFAVSQLNEFGIIARSSFIIEIPKDSMSDIHKTIDFINKLRKYKFFTCGMTTFRPYPKCELTADLVASGEFVEPKTLEEWQKQEVVDLYTMAEQKRPWQVDGEYSEKACFYINMQSAVRLQNHQIGSLTDLIVNSLFIWIATIRNKFKFYGFAIDKISYKIFLKGFYKRLQDQKLTT